VFVPIVKICGEYYLLLTRRSTRISHPGQISFPGGHIEDNETLLECAIREMREEIGASPSSLEEVCPLNVNTTVTSGKVITSFVGFIDNLEFKLDRREVEDVIFLSLKALMLTPPETIIMPNGKKTIRYRFPGFVVWGATARIIEASIQKILQIIEGREDGSSDCLGANEVMRIREE
jgi:8-oxo-dGTP pyrophosphatase MutT (NUDIX family)